MLPERLYWSNRNRVRYNSKGRSLHFAKGASLELDAFFNTFAAKQWADSKGRHHLSYKLSGEGSVFVEIKARKGQDNFLLSSSILALHSDHEALLPIPDVFHTASDADKLLYVTIYSEEEAVIWKGGFFTNLPAPNRVKTAIIITHFKREEWVLPAVARLKRELFEDETVRDLAHVFVIDNSRSLPMESDEHFTVVRNRNLGGAGGFMRGLLEAEVAGGFSHCLFMDDDATTEIESIKRALRYLSYASPRSCVAGALNLLDKPSVVFESKGDWHEGARPVCLDLDVGDRANLEEFVEHDERGRYAGWWFFAFPIRELRKYAFPYFVRGDDVAFGLDNRFRMKTLLGVACWAESFESKDSITTTYLDYRASFRNSIVLDTCGSFALIRRLLSNLVGIVASYRYAAAEAALIGVRDSIRSHEFWLHNMDMAAARTRLAPLTKEEVFLPRHEFSESAGLDVPPARPEFEESLFRKLIRMLTLNGHLIPGFCCPRDPVTLPKTYILSFSMIFPHTKVCLHRSTDDSVVLLRRDLRRALCLLWRILGTVTVYAFHALFLKKRLKKTHDLLTTRDFWLDVYPECREREGQHPAPDFAGASN